MPYSSYKDLIVWQKAMALVEQGYALTAKLPVTERHGLASQMQRAAVSIPSNIAEGSRRGTRKDYAQFLRIAHGSSAELETQLILVERLYEVREVRSVLELLDEIQKMLHAILRKL